MDCISVPADASSLIYLAKADAFREAHSSVGMLLAPPAVWQEAVEAGIDKGIADPQRILSAQSAGWVRATPIGAQREHTARVLARQYRLGRGETQVLAMGKRATRVLIDDLRAVRVAVALGFTPVSTVLLPVLGVRERGLSRQVAMDMLRRLAAVVTLPAQQLQRLEAMLGERR